MWIGSELKCNLANICMIMFKVAGFVKKEVQYQLELSFSIFLSLEGEQHPSLGELIAVIFGTF